MKNLLLEFAELPKDDNIDFSIVEYDSMLNLNVIKGTKIPAVTYSCQTTQTFTKTVGEGADADKNFARDLLKMLDTSTHTRVQHEESDSDPRHKLMVMLDTATKTFVQNEGSDSDK